MAETCHGVAWRRAKGSNRVNRGGSWNNNGRNCRSANRNRNTPDNRNNNLGFRLAATPPGPSWKAAPAEPARLPSSGGELREANLKQAPPDVGRATTGQSPGPKASGGANRARRGGVNPPEERRWRVFISNLTYVRFRIIFSSESRRQASCLVENRSQNSAVQPRGPY